MKIELLSIQRGNFNGEYEAAEYIKNSLRKISELRSCTINIHKRSEMLADMYRVKYDIIIVGNIPDNFVHSIPSMLSFTHYRVDNVMHRTNYYLQTLKYKI